MNRHGPDRGQYAVSPRAHCRRWYALYRNLTWAGMGQQAVTLAFAGGLLLNAFASPLLMGIVTGALAKWFIGWLRSGKVKRA